jgi:hypothetical protein
VAHKFRQGNTRSPHVSRGAGLAIACTLLIVGCGEGATGNATATVYASTPLCAGAERQLARSSGRAGDTRVRVICLTNTEDRGGLDLAQIGANARRATEDSSSVAYIAELNPAARDFSLPILEEAKIAQLSRNSGAASMSTVLRALRDAESSDSLRETVFDALQ